MIHSLSVRNIALIDQLNIEFEEGLNVLSGETGAGKSIIVDSMNLVLGERADKELIRHGTERAHVEAILYIDASSLKDFFDDNGIDCDDELIISRDLSITGKNICRINGTAVNLATLKKLTDQLIDLHGQHQHQSLLYQQNHLTFVDDYGRSAIVPLKRQCADLYSRLQSLQKQLASIGGDERERAQSIDLLSFQIQDISQAEIRAGELDALKEERDKMAHAQGISQALCAGYEELYAGDEMNHSALSLLQDTVNRLSDIAQYDEQYRTVLERLQENVYGIEECAHDMRALSENVFYDEQRQEEIEQRIDLINSLKRKYGADEEEILAYLSEAEDKLYRLQNADKLAEQLATEIRQAEDELYSCCVSLSSARRKAAELLEHAVLSELTDLGMQNARFEARFSVLPERAQAVFRKNGIDEMEFYISTNAGEPLKPLSKTASGGEVSRIMLAFKNLAAGADNIGTMVFDEIDTGISGKMALTVAEKMASISRARQVICVSHLPQIAAMADANYLISKQTDNGVTNTRIEKLDETQAVAEVARLAGGIESENSMKYAQELIANAKRYKASLPHS